MFELFNEIGIIEQLSRTAFEAVMTDGMTLPQFSVLNHLVRVGDGRTPLAIARAFQVPKTSMSHTLAKLDQADLIEMRPNPEDGRGKLVFITAKGRAARESAIHALAPEIAQILPVFTVQEAAALLPGLRKLREFLDKARDPL
ncbi:DNA-binding MarR family transcriptional regulator [Rubricella aquisinus]|uniref:DNA-binding MarR family transcriptional regulator n=1 Tax=Rubricella aquisinus TaxID=2028108 RepID=A0A840WWC8_9RHOB|nr:MarR family winged helix-turn-helix transcriptional regulator [Rubricella aquisinus]MBB5515490.1 DNA-binding MarR family transcriptional regulator [Rubricella aquisinus]